MAQNPISKPFRLMAASHQDKHAALYAECSVYDIGVVVSHWKNHLFNISPHLKLSLCDSTWVAFDPRPGNKKVVAQLWLEASEEAEAYANVPDWLPEIYLSKPQLVARAAKQKESRS